MSRTWKKSLVRVGSRRNGRPAMRHSPIRILVKEHRMIRRVVDTCAETARTIKEGQNVNIELLAKITAFMQQYADKCHHAKEEDLLFPAFERAGVPSEGCPLAALRYEHKEGRAIVAALHEALKLKRTATILSSLHGIVALYPNHIWKEEFLLFPLAKKLLSPQVQEELFTAFMAVDQALGSDMLNAHVAFAKRLSMLK
jgi:hemerythrin-like domain-containing protein